MLNLYPFVNRQMLVKEIINLSNLIKVDKNIFKTRFKSKNGGDMQNGISVSHFFSASLIIIYVS